MYLGFCPVYALSGGLEDFMLYEARVFTSVGIIYGALAFNKAEFNKRFGTIFGHAVGDGETITRAECNFLTEEEARDRYPWRFGPWPQ